MSKRTTMVLGGIAIAMLAYIVFFERGTLSTGELEARRGRVIETFVRPRVTRLELTVGDRHIVLVKAETDEGEDLDTFGVGEWTMEGPVHAAADSEAVDGLLSSLEWLDARRTIEGIGADDRHRFGLDAPQAEVAFTVAGEAHHLLVGGEDPRGEGLYVTLDEGDTAWIVGRDLLEAVQHDADHFRSKELFPTLRPRDARRVEIANADTHAVAERSEDGDAHAGPWQLVDPVHGYARGAGVESLLQFATHARATRFLSEEAPTDLGEPTRDLRIERAEAPEGATGDDAERAPLRLRVYGACPEHADEVIALVNDGPEICLLLSDVEPLDVSLERLRELRLVTTADDRVDAITLTRGTASFSIHRVEGGWRIGEGDAAREADEAAVGELMAALRAQEAQEMVPLTDEALDEHGLTTPAATIVIARTDDTASETVVLGSADAVGVWVRRGDEQQVARYDLAVRDLLAREAITFRRRRLAERSADDATEVRITRGTALEVIRHREDGWHVTEPAELVADEASVRDVARAIGGLEALRFVADTAAPAHGLDHPRFSATVHFAAGEDAHAHEGDEEGDDDHDEGPVDLTLRIGAATEGGAFASLEGDAAVFVVSPGVVDALAHPLVSRDLLAMRTGEISALTITGPGGVVALREQGDGWATDLGPAASGPATALLDRLASLHAIGVESYGGAIPSPVVVVEATHRDGSPATRLEIGPVAGGEGALPYRLARITGVDATFRVQDADAIALIDYRAN